jgi:toxin CcdB
VNQFDVFQTRGDAARLAPFLVLLQSDLLGALASVVVAPLRPEALHGAQLNRLHVPLPFLGEPHVLAPEQLVSLPRAALGPRVGSLAEHRQTLMGALDFLFLGF